MVLDRNARTGFAPSQIPKISWAPGTFSIQCWASNNLSSCGESASSSGLLDNWFLNIVNATIQIQKTATAMLDKNTPVTNSSWFWERRLERIWSMFVNFRENSFEPSVFTRFVGCSLTCLGIVGLLISTLNSTFKINLYFFQRVSNFHIQLGKNIQLA